jgi:hypothetical protein
VILMTHACLAHWLPWSVRQLSGENRADLLPAQRQVVTESWDRIVRSPYLAYMPEQDRLLMIVSCDTPLRSMALFSEDRGATWTEPRYLHTDADGLPDYGHAVSLTCLGAGSLLVDVELRRCRSADYGQTWTDVGPVPPGTDGGEAYQWDPYMVDRDPQAGSLIRLTETWHAYYDPSGRLDLEGRPDAFLRFSADGGRTWGDEVRPPQWHHVSEVALVRAANGDLVAGCRTTRPAWYEGDLDHYSGLATSVSHDDGRTWSELNRRYEFGRHHPSFAVLPSGDVLMVYVVRRGYPADPEGFPQFGIEAVLSHDHGQTWDMAHRFLLDRWSGTRIAEDDWWSAPQSTSTVLLPDGWLLTAYGTGYRCDQPFTSEGVLGPHDIGLIRWQVRE